MGVTITANNSNYAFNGGYIGFMSLRKRIANNLDREFGEHYATLTKCSSSEDYDAFDKKSNEIIERKQLDDDVLDFLFASDCEGKINHKTCKKIYEIIKDDNEPLIFTYAAYSDGKDFENFKNFLIECYSRRRNMVWW